MHFEIYQQSGSGGGALSSAIFGEWRWRLRAANGEIIANGESYRNRADCLHAINLVKLTGPLTPVQGP